MLTFIGTRYASSASQAVPSPRDSLVVVSYTSSGISWTTSWRVLTAVYACICLIAGGKEERAHKQVIVLETQAHEQLCQPYSVYSLSHVLPNVYWYDMCYQDGFIRSSPPMNYIAPWKLDEDYGCQEMKVMPMSQTRQEHHGALPILFQFHLQVSQVFLTAYSICIVFSQSRRLHVIQHCRHL